MLHRGSAGRWSRETDRGQGAPGLPAPRPQRPAEQGQRGPKTSGDGLALRDSPKAGTRGEDGSRGSPRGCGRGRSGLRLSVDLCTSVHKCANTTSVRGEARGRKRQNTRGSHRAGNEVRILTGQMERPRNSEGAGGPSEGRFPRCQPVQDPPNQSSRQVLKASN